MPLDYETLRIIWWLLIGILLIGFAIMDGFDLGVAMWLPWLGRTDIERRILINSIGPTWEGNQVWFILGGGAIFAAWPTLYALSFSGFYMAMLVVLLALILRPVGFKYRSKLDNPTWRAFWDWALFIGGFVPALIFGVAVGNVIQGVPFYFDESLRVFYTGSFFELLNPFALGCGLLSVLMLAMHGAFFIQVKTVGALQNKAKDRARWSAILVILLFIGLGIWAYYGIDGYVLKGMVPHDGPSNPSYKDVSIQAGAWFNNYKEYPVSLLVPVLCVVSAFLAIIFANKSVFAFVLSGLSVGTLIATVGVSMFPFILPSSSNPKYSLIVWDSSSSQVTLFIMLVATVLLLPVVLAYTAWVYRVLRGKVTESSIKAEQDSAY
ncbi:TPA: cytochrome d ubiquinol oxidase subunit II [Legionella pneumophila subsp. pneumophila]|uniref:Cytochrome d ubiquinol oxidase subunit II n=2 Tax=Legionella pneumophila TaxID=446 RepID=A0A2S6EYW8_LEGPN|nr:cytochrome d ubiquinol oxidase subunit II [Legionella pneumophila]AOW52193.1 cytochrome d ubiquinol oxidase subunit II [Legionella pneumophila subsp. pneumophila]AOW54218.1 cytochrome d ubiquinol oxidase subunit II [Legionella pneumophila subsp. pneumophila]AOW57491.1 cytochrome d ubiquinol oxidase subunit II [Legionella pneumophila subsp. pneumophila]AOW62331.1 cytochrome d ubiquinol oxidase subunit II [Legionella pneumophila subsp. pneumophila]AOW62988.1 cytochrome d ubiquinol oxidase sub